MEPSLVSHVKPRAPNRQNFGGLERTVRLEAPIEKRLSRLNEILYNFSNASSAGSLEQARVAVVDCRLNNFGGTL
jgi:hypothetical protein